MEPTPLEQAIAAKSTGLTFERDALLSATSRIIGALDRKGPITSHVLIHAEGEQATLRAMSADMQATATVPCRGSLLTTAPGEQLRAIAQALAPGAQVSLTQAERLHVKSGRSTWKLPTVAPDLFAEWPALDDQVTFTLSASQLASDLARVAVSAAKDDNRGPHLQGVFAHADGVLRFAATNSHRLATVVTDTRGDFKGCVLAPKFVAETIRICDGMTDCTLTLGSSRATLECGAARLTGKVLDGLFPPYQRLNPAHCDTLTFRREDMLGALKRLLIVGEGRKGLRISVADGVAHLTARNMDSTEGQDEVVCERDGDDISFEISSTYLADALAQFTGERVTLRTGTPKQPMVMAEGDLTQLIVPQFTGAA